MIVKRYKSGYQIRINKKGIYYLYHKKGDHVICDSLKDACFTHWCLTH